jgi:hypothetical protein
VPTIEELLHRRTDRSTFVVHFTRDLAKDDDATAHRNLMKILEQRRIRAGSVHGMAKELAERYPAVAEKQRVVCFTETPLEHAWMMCSEIEGHEVQLCGYGVAFTKSFARRQGANPVWFLDNSQQGRDWLTVSVEWLVDEAQEAATTEAGETDPKRLAGAPILRLTPFMQVGPIHWDRGRKEFWWEREWRHVGDLQFTAQDLVVVFAPEAEHEEIRQCLEGFGGYQGAMPALVDAQWGQERMIAAIAAVPSKDLGPSPGLPV